jgi:hypothetical protein
MPGVSLYHTGTEYVANAITFTRGNVSDVVSVGVYHNTNPTTIPAVGDFTTCILVDGTVLPLPPLGETGFIDILSLIGPRGSGITLTPGDYQRWCLISTATEDIIRMVDTITIL